MYEHDYDDCANEEQFTEEALQDGLRQLITDGAAGSEICWKPADFRPSPRAGLAKPATAGLVIALPDNSNSTHHHPRAGDTLAQTIAWHRRNAPQRSVAGSRTLSNRARRYIS